MQVENVSLCNIYKVLWLIYICVCVCVCVKIYVRAFITFACTACCELGDVRQCGRARLILLMEFSVVLLIHGSNSVRFTDTVL